MAMYVYILIWKRFFCARYKCNARLVRCILEFVWTQYYSSKNTVFCNVVLWQIRIPGNMSVRVSQLLWLQHELDHKIYFNGENRSLHWRQWSFLANLRQSRNCDTDNYPTNRKLINWLGFRLNHETNESVTHFTTCRGHFQIPHP